MKQIYHFTGTAGKQQSLKAGVALLLMGVMLTLLPTALQAQVLKPFTQRASIYSPDMPIYHIKGDYTLIGNTNLTLATYSDNAYNTNMIYVNVDPNMVNSSTAELTFSDEFGANPACSEVLYAGLYWSGRATSGGMDLTVGTTLYDEGEIGGYTLNIDGRDNNRSFTFTNGSDTVELTMNRSYLGPYYTVSNGGVQIYSGNSTTASITVTLPGTNYTITQLQWGNGYSTDFSAVVTTALSKNKIKIRHATAPGYTEVEATPQDIYYATHTDYDYAYAAYAEVTDYVRQYGLGNYTVADLASEAGNGGSTGFFGCWGMVVVYENSKMKWRDITIFDGFANVRDGNTVDVPISGFKTVQVGDVNMKLGVIVSEGDVRNSGDAMKILRQGTTDEFVALSHDLNSTNNFFNSSISTGGNNRNPEYRNNSGIDIAMFELDNENNSVITNNQTSTHFQFTTDADIYFPFCFVMGVDAYIPEAEALSGVMDIDEDDISIDSQTGNYLIDPGKEITFEVEVKNFGTEDIVNAKLEIPLPSTIEYYYAEVDYVYPGINIEGYFDAERYANGVAGWNIDYIPSGYPDTVYARVLLTVKVTEDCYVLASTDEDCELAIEVNGTLEGTSYVNGVYFKKESFISGFADETGCQGNAIRNDIKVVVNKESYVDQKCNDQDYTVRLVKVCGNDFNATNPIPFMDIYALYPQGSRFFNATTSEEYTAATGFPISLAATDSASAKLIHVQPTSIYSAACTSDLRFILDPDGDSFTTPTLIDSSATYCLDALADSLSRHISTPPSGIYYRFYKDSSNSAVAYVDIVPPTDVEDTLKYWVRQFRKNAIGCEDERFFGPITIKVVSPITFTSSEASPSCIGDAVTIIGRPAGGEWSWPNTLTGITVSDSVLIIDGNSAGTYTVTYTHNNPGSAGYSCTNTVRSYTHQIAATTDAGELQSDQTICQGAQIQPLQIVDHNGHVERWEWTTDTTAVWDWIPNNTSSISTADLGELAEGIYYFRALVKDGNCDTAWTNTVTITVRADDAPNPPTVTSPQYACIGTDYTIAPSGDNYQWYEQAIGGWPIEDASGDPANSITVTITDEWITRYVSEVDNSTGCVSNRAEVQVRPNLEPGEINDLGQRECDLNDTAYTIGSDQNAVAYGGTVIYQWYYQVNGDTTWQTIDGADSATFTPQAFMDREGDYIFIRKAKNSNCENWQQSRGKWRLVVGEPDASIKAVPGHATICQNGGIKLHLSVPASTAYSYQWYRNEIAIDTNGTGHAYIATVPGTYTARVTHKASGCSATTPAEDAIEVKYDEAAPRATSVTRTINGCSIAAAQAVPKYSNVIDANASGLGFNISDAITPEDSLKLTYEDEIVNSPTGACYQLVRTYTVTDQCGLDTTFTHTINVVDREAPSIGEIEVPAAVPAGSCKYKIPDLSAATLDVSSDNCSDVSFVEQTPAAGSEYSQTNTERTVTVVVKVKDACGNETRKEVQITIPAIPTISAAGSALDCYGDSDGNISYTITGGTAGYTVVLSGGSATQTATPTPTAAGTYTFTGLAAGTYTVTVTDDNGCTATASATVSQPDPLSVSLTKVDETCAGDDGKINYTIAGGTAGYTVVLSGGSANQTVTQAEADTYTFIGLKAGTYTVTVADEHGCTATISATIKQPDPLQITILSSASNCYGQDDGYINYTFSGGTPVYTVSIGTATNKHAIAENGSFTGSFTNLADGPYTVTVTDTNGCTTTDTTTIQQINTTLTITAQSYTWEYDGQTHTRPYYDVTFGSEQYSNIAPDSSATLPNGDVVTATVSGSITNAGTADNTVTHVTVKRGDTDVTCYYNIVTENRTLTITPRPVTITAASDSKEYDGTPLTNDDYTNSDLATGDVIESVTVTGSITEVGTVANVPSAAVIMDGEENVTANYTIDYVNGELEVTQTTRELRIVANSTSWQYDSEIHSDGGYTVTYGDESYTVAAGGSATLSTGDVVTATITKTVKNVSETVEGNNEIVNLVVENQSQYSNIVTVDGTLTITQKPVTIKADSASKQYDGTALTKDSYTHTALAAGDSIYSVTVTGSQIVVGSSDNVPSAAVIMDGEENVTANYNINYVNGTLTVTPRSVTLTSATDSKIYDGTPLTNSTVTVGGDGFVTGEGATYDVTGTITNVGSCSNAFTYTLNSNTDANNYTITKIEGTLTILIDSVPPCIGCDPIAGVSCETIGNQTRTNDENQNYYTHSGTAWDVNATDNSGAIPVMTWSLTGVTTASGNSTLDGQRFNVGVTTVTWTATDVTGNPATCQFTVTVADTTDPVISCPSDIAGIACITDVPAAYTDYAAFQTAGGELTDNDVVDYESFALVDADTNGTCPTTITRTYYIEDTTGNSATCTQVITIMDSIAPALAGTWPTNITGQDNCLANRNISGLKSDDAIKALYSDCNTFTVIHKDTVTGNNCGWTVTRTYTITDACDNSVTKTMSVSGSDRTAPVLAGTWPSDITGQNSCLSTADTTGLKDDSEIKALYSDCSTITVTHTDTIEGNACGWTVTRTYTITDACTNSVTKTMSVSGSDRTAPVIESINLDSTLTSTNCVFTIPDMRDEVRNISTDCSEITVTQPSAGMEVYPMVAERDTTVNVIVTDICGNSSVKEVIITIPAKVTISATATPAVICNGDTSQLSSTAANVVGTAVYAWTPATELSSATIANPTVTLTASGASETVTYTVMVTDDNGCTATATASVTVNPEVVMNTVEDWTLCVGETSPEYVYTSTITDGTVTYGWRNNTPAIGLAAMGEGNLPSFVAANATSADLIAEVKVAPTYANNGISCQGDSINFHITVRPSIKTPGNVAFTCPADTTVVLSYSECEQFVNIGYPEFVNNMTGMDVVITNDAPADSIFPEGTTIVTWTATDECGAFLTCTQNVVVQFPSCGDSIADFDGYRYSSVRIGCQCWTGENARSEHYSDGTPVDNFRYYNDSDSLENIYGKLYTWYTAVRVPEGDDTAVPADSIDPLGNSYVQGICPEGWALPTVDEYMLMIANSGDATHAKDGSNLYWLPGYEGQPPFSGFDAYGAGKYNEALARYEGLLGKTYFWTTLNVPGSETATTVEINYYCAEGLQTELSKGDGVSIRCIRKR